MYFVEEVSEIEGKDNIVAVKIYPTGSFKTAVVPKDFLKKGDFCDFVEAGHRVDTNNPKFKFLEKKADKDGIHLVENVRYGNVYSQGVTTLHDSSNISTVISSVIPSGNLLGSADLNKIEMPRYLKPRCYPIHVKIEKNKVIRILENSPIYHQTPRFVKYVINVENNFEPVFKKLQKLKVDSDYLMEFVYQKRFKCDSVRMYVTVIQKLLDDKYVSPSEEEINRIVDELGTPLFYKV